MKRAAAEKTPGKARRARGAASGSSREAPPGTDRAACQPPPATAPRGPTAAEARASVVPFARVTSELGARLVLELQPTCALVSGRTYRAIQWGGAGHRDGLLEHAPSLVAHVRSLLAPDGPGPSADAPAWLELPHCALGEHLDEWQQLPHAVPQLEPSAGYVFVSTERQTLVPPRSAVYNRMLIEEGVPPKQVPRADYEAEQAALRRSEKAASVAGAKLGECAPLGVRLRVVRTSRDGDCFFDAVAKAFGAGEADGRGGAVCAAPVWRDRAMWAAAHGDAGGGPPPSPAEPLSVAELRRVCAGCYSEEIWQVARALRTASCGGAQFAYAAESLQATREHIATPACAMGESGRGHLAYWADESAVAAVQRYLHCRLLIFSPHAPAAHRCQAAGELDERPGVPPRWLLLRRTHAAEEHYELLALGGRAVFARDELPDGVVAAFSGRVSF